MSTLTGVCVGAGYFAKFHFDAWRRMNDVNILAVCDHDESRAREAAELVGAQRWFSSLTEALDATNPDFVDLITPPPGKLELVQACADKGISIICQKPLADDYVGAQRIVAAADSAEVRLMVHENFRFQPWRREMKRLLEQETIGQMHTITIRTRLGDGWGEDAYLDRQPYFRDMSRLLIHETGVHFFDTFRYLAGEIAEVTATLRRMNQVITGEDAALVTVQFESGAYGVWDANRYNETTDENPRLTFGETFLEGDLGTIRLDGAGRLFVKRLGKPEHQHEYAWEAKGFAGDCVYATQRHFIDCIKSGDPFETSGEDYLRSLAAVEAAYQSSAENRPICPTAAPRVVDLTREINSDLPGAAIETAKQIEVDGWNATSLNLYSHCGTHMDAPCHFLPGAATLDEQELGICCGPARVIDLTPVEPAELLTVERLVSASPDIRHGDRLLLRTDWHLRYPDKEYRNALPRISAELAQWFVDQGVSMIGVEPPSVADVNNLDEVTQVHQILFRGGVLIVEGLCNLNKLQSPRVDFIALPLRIKGGDGSPVRAIAIVR